MPIFSLYPGLFLTPCGSALPRPVYIVAQGGQTAGYRPKKQRRPSGISPSERAARRACPIFLAGCGGKGRAGRAGPALPWRKIPAAGGGGVWRPGGPQGRPACQTKERGPGSLAPGPALSGRFASSRRPPSAGVSTNAKKATQKPGLSPNPAPLRPPPGKRW